MGGGRTYLKLKLAVGKTLILERGLKQERQQSGRGSWSCYGEDKLPQKWWLIGVITTGVIGIIVLVISFAIPTYPYKHIFDSSLPKDTEVDYVIRVSGTDGLPFTGSYMVISRNISISQSVEGRIPKEYKLHGSMVSAVFQKQTQEGILILGIFKNGQPGEIAKTGVSYGVVSVAK